MEHEGLIFPKPVILKEKVQTEVKKQSVLLSYKLKLTKTKHRKSLEVCFANTEKQTAILRSYRFTREVRCVRIIESLNNKNAMLVPQKVSVIP